MTELAEINPASDWCQRWRGGQHSWRHRSEGGFDPARLAVDVVDERTAKAFVTEHHYSGTYPSAAHRFGLFQEDQLVGVAVLSIPTSRGVLANVFPDLEPYSEAVELGRLVLLEDIPANAESFMLARVFRMAAAAGVRGIVSFADPVPRRVAGRLLFPGHVGTIYQASNARYCGRATPRTLVVLPDGAVLNARAMQKVRAQDRGHDHVERRLVGLGARPLRAGETPTAWLASALDQVGAERLRHRGNHRYAFALGSRTERRHLRIAPAAEAFPKRPDLEAA